MSTYYSDDEDIDVHVHSSRPGVQYRPRPRSYYGQSQGASYLVPEQRTIIATRERSRSRDRRQSPPSAAPPAPVIINNRIYNDLSSDDEDGHLAVGRPHRRSSHSRNRASSSSQLMTKEEYEMERARRELEALRMEQTSREKQMRTEKELREEAELRRAKQELEAIRSREERQKEEDRIKRELELQRLREQEREEAEKERREKEAKEAVERYKKKEMERQMKEEEEKAAMEKEYQRRLQEDLIKSGLDEKQIAAIIKKEKVPEVRDEQADGARPTYTRMARRHLSIETLRSFRIEYELDNDPDYILIKRWVPEWEQDTLWKHTRHVREKRTKLLVTVDDRKHHHHHHHSRDRDADFEWVRKKSDRRRSKSPSLLMYLAGAKPA